MTYAIKQRGGNYYWTGSAWRDGKSYAREYENEKDAERGLRSLKDANIYGASHASVVKLFSTIHRTI